METGIIKCLNNNAVWRRKSFEFKIYLNEAPT